MHVLYFHQYFATRGRATPTRSYELARRLAERGHQVTIVSRDTRALELDRTERPRGRLWARERIDGIDVVYLAMPYSQFMSAPARMASFAGFTVAAALAGLGLPRPDVVFASSTPLTIGIPGLMVSRLKGVPFVFEIRDLWPAVPVELGMLRHRSLARWAERLELDLYAEAQRVVVLSEASHASLTRRGVPADKLVFIPNASDLDLFRPDVIDYGFRARHGLDDRFVALYTGAMGRANGLAQLVDAAELMAAGGSRVAFVCIGDGTERAAQQARVQASGLDNVHFLEPVAKHRLAGIVGAADVTLTLFAPYPSLQSNSPNKFFDSLAAGRPVVVNLDGWLRRLVEDDGAGAYVPAGDGAALATTLAALAAEPQVVARMGRNARSLAEREFDRDLMADRLAVALEEAVATADHGGRRTGTSAGADHDPDGAGPGVASRRPGGPASSDAPAGGAGRSAARVHEDRPAVVLGLLHAGLAIVRSLGRSGVPVHGIAFSPADFAIGSRYLRSRHVVPDPMAGDGRRPGDGPDACADRDRRTLEILARIAADGRRLVLFPERDEHVAFVLRNWDAVAEVADVPLPPDPDVTWSLRRKERLARVAVAAGVPAPATVHAHCEQAIRGSGLRPPFLLKPVEGQDFALYFGEKVMIAESVDEAVAKWRAASDAGFETLVQEFIPESSDRIWSLLTYISTDGRPLGSVVGRKVRQGPLKFGTSAFFEVDHDDRVLDHGLRLLLHAGYRGLAHVEMAYDVRDDTFKLLEVNTRPPVWFGLAVNDRFDMARLAYADLCGHAPLTCRLFREDLAWAYLAKDLYVSCQMARCGELDVAGLVRDYRKRKVRAVFAADDPLPAVRSLRYLLARV